MVPAALTAACRKSLGISTYTRVVSVLACPSRALTASRSRVPAKARVPNLCRRVCAVHGVGSAAAISFETWFGVMCPPRRAGARGKELPRTRINVIRMLAVEEW